MITFTCPGCGFELNVKIEVVEKSSACPRCKKLWQMAERAPAGAAESRVAVEDAALSSTGNNSSWPEGERLDFLAPPQGPDELGRLGSYRILKVLGSGGMGMVLLAEDSLLKRSVALKVMRPERAAQAGARQRFLREAQATAAIEHPHIVHVYQVGEDRGVPFLVMPFLKGESLEERLKRDRKLPLAEVVPLGRQIAEGLAAAHRNGLIHRDIKPGNLWLEAQDGERPSPRSGVKILDFGLARAVNGEDGQLTKNGAILGTPAYMSPEQARGEKADARSDLFSLGVVLYRMLTGETPFPGNDPFSLLMALASVEPRPVLELVPDAPPALADLIHCLLTKNPEQRPASAREVADALAEMEAEGAQPLPDPTASVPGQQGKASTNQQKKTKFRWLLPAASGGLLGALLAAGLIVFARFSPPSGGGQPPRELPAVHPGAAEVVVNGIGMKLKLIGTGKFTMGSPANEPGRGKDEEAHEVAITRPFYVGVHKVTVGQFRAFILDTGYRTEAEKNGTGSYYRLPDNQWRMSPGIAWQSPDFSQEEDHPVVCVSRNDALAFCAWLSQKERRPYALPTEAQWEYCCRAGSRTRFFFGDDAAQLSQYAWYFANSDMQTHPVGQKKPNAWGLFDMIGNAYELTADWYAADYGKNRLKEDPAGPSEGVAVVARGCGWANLPEQCRSACRQGYVKPDERSTNHGFRVVLLR